MTNRAVFLLSLAAFASAASLRATDTLLPQLATEFSVTAGGAASVVTAFAISYGLLQAVYGPLGDRYGRYVMVVRGHPRFGAGHVRLRLGAHAGHPHPGALSRRDDGRRAYPAVDGLDRRCRRLWLAPGADHAFSARADPRHGLRSIGRRRAGGALRLARDFRRPRSAVSDCRHAAPTGAAHQPDHAALGRRRLGHHPLGTRAHGRAARAPLGPRSRRHRVSRGHDDVRIDRFHTGASATAFFPRPGGRRRDGHRIRCGRSALRAQREAFRRGLGRARPGGGRRAAG